MQSQFHFVLAQGADRLLQVNLALVQRDIELGLELIGNHARGDRAEHLAVLARLDRDNAKELRDALAQLGHGIELVGLPFGAALFQGLEPSLIGAGDRDGQALWEKIIAGVAGSDLHLVGLGPQIDDITRKDDFGFCHMREK